VQHTRFADAECPIARSLDAIGEWWSLLILRDALDGATRFDQFSRNLGIPPTTLTRRLRTLVYLNFDSVEGDKTSVTLRNFGYGQGEEWAKTKAYFERAWPAVMANLEKRFAKP